MKNLRIPYAIRSAMAVAALVCGALLAPAALAQDSLHYFNNYFVAGNYVVGGVGVRGTGVDGFATGMIDMTGADLPDNVDIVAAFLYWETVVSMPELSTDPIPTSAPPSAAGAEFEGHDIGSIARVVNPSGSSPCWSSGGAAGSPDGSHKMLVHRADVLRFLEPDPVTGKLVVKKVFEVKLPDSGSGHAVPSTAGASLVVIYRDPAEPLRSIVIYDGGFTMDQSTDMMTQTIEGFYQASTSGAQGRLTHIVGDGQANFPERLKFNGSTIAESPFVGAEGDAWDNPTYTVNVPGDASSVTTTVDHVGTPFDCLSWGAVIFSVTVQDTDADGLLDVWETTSHLLDPKGRELPDLPAMGADPNAKDLFVEIGYMEAPAPYINPDGSVPMHTHLPSKAVLDRAGDVFLSAPDPIHVHFDVGNRYQSPPDPYIIGAAQARGGGSVNETDFVCVPDETADPPVTCQFPNYPGVVGWKSGYQSIRDEPLNYPDEPSCTEAEDCERRFDENRHNSFHYALFAHALGIPRSTDPHLPNNTSGIADFPGRDLMVTLGLWDNAVGSEYIQTATLLHELGHNLYLRHGGGVNPVTQLPEPNCKPNYQSVMSYLFQVRGLLNASGDPVADYSRQVLSPLDESNLVESDGLGASLFRPRWYAPAPLLASTSPVSKRCDGSLPSLPGEDMVYLDDAMNSGTIPVDWNADGDTTDTVSFDANFLGSIDGPYHGFDDFALMDLRHVASGRNVGSSRIGGGLSINEGFGDLGFGDLGFGDLGFGDLGFGDLGFGDLGFGDLGFGDLGFGDLGFGDLGFGDLGADNGDVDFDTAKGFGNPPTSLTAAVTGNKQVTVSWHVPVVGDSQVISYQVYRVEGASVTTIAPSNFLASVNAPQLSFVDETVKKNRIYTYAAVAIYQNGMISSLSNLSPPVKP